MSLRNGPKVRRLSVLLGFAAFFFAFFLPAEIGKLMASGDALFETLPAFLGHHHLWEPKMLLGYPLYADPNQQTFYPPMWFGIFPNTFNAFAVFPFVIGAFAMWGFVRLLTGETAAGIGAGLVYVLGGFMISHAGHLMISHTAAWAPFVFWGIEAYRRDGRLAALAGSAVALALCAIAGQPVVFVFAITLAAAYGIVSASTAPQGRNRFLRAIALTLLLGTGIGCVQLIPEAVLGHASTRASIALDAYTAFEIPASQLALRAIFPYALGTSATPGFAYSRIDIGTFTEDTIAVGVVALLLALLASAEFVSDRRVAFWSAVAVGALLLAIGDATPLAAIVHKLPVYGLLRAPGRHAFEWTFAIAVLAGYGTRAILRGAISTKRFAIAVALVAAFGIAGYLEFSIGTVSTASDVAQLYGVDVARVASPFTNAALGVPLLVAIVGTALLAAALRVRGRRFAGAIVAIAIALDMGTFAWPAYWNWAAVTTSALDAPPFAASLASKLTERSTRLAWLPGNLANALPPNLTTLWNIPSVDGYTPLLPQRIALLLDTAPSGAIPIPKSGDVRLDLAGASLLAVPSVAVVPVTVGQPFAPTPIHLFFSKRFDDALRHADLALAQPFAATSIAMVSDLGDSLDVPQHADVGTITIVYVDGRREKHAVLAGRDTAEFAYDRPDVRPRMRHARATVYESAGSGHTYLANIAVGSHRPIRRLEFDWTYPTAALTIEKLSMIDASTKAAQAFGELASLYAAPDHWQPTTIEAGTNAFENRHVLPRVWIAHPVGEVALASARLAARIGTLPGGGAFDPRRDALVEDSIPSTAVSAADSASVSSDTTYDVVARTTCAAACYLVLRDAYDTNWKASIDGVAAPIHATDIALRGVAVPAGAHDVRFRFVPWPLYLGLALTLLSALATLTLVVLASRSRALRAS